MTFNTQMWNSAFLAWLAWCVVARGSRLIAPSVADHLASPLAAVIAGAVGVALGWLAWSRRSAEARARPWLRPRAWPTSCWVAIVVGALWLALQAIEVRHGRVSTLFGMYVVCALLAGAVHAAVAGPPAVAGQQPPA